MKLSLLLKFILVLPSILFLDFLLMVLLGCTTCLLGFGEDFYCGTYCIFGKIVLAFSAVLFLFLIFPDIRELFKKLKNAPTKKE
jgi:hypothetical protein